MNHRDYVADREAHDAAFRAARDSMRPQHEFRRALVATRLASGLTQAELADQLGTTQSAVARLEQGLSLPRVDTLCRLASVLGVDFEITPEAGLTVRARRH